MAIRKEVHFKLPLTEWEEFYRIFPEIGGRTGFLRKCIQEAIRLGPQSRFVQQIRKRIEEDS